MGKKICSTFYGQHRAHRATSCKHRATRTELSVVSCQLSALRKSEIGDRRSEISESGHWKDKMVSLLLQGITYLHSVVTLPVAYCAAGIVHYPLPIPPQAMSIVYCAAGIELIAQQALLPQGIAYLHCVGTLRRRH